MLKKVVLSIFLSLVMLSAALCGCAGSSGIGAAGISLEEFKKISAGMTQEKVEEIIGGKGTKISESQNDTDKYIEFITVYRYDGETSGYAEIEYSLKSQKKILAGVPKREVSSIKQYDLS